jgi:Flp pilus assembly protein TadG
MRTINDDKGSVTAELAVALPTICLMLIFGLTQMREFSERSALQADLAQYARALARQEPENKVAQWFAKRHSDAHINKSRQGGALCVSAVAPSLLGKIPLKHCVWVGDY